MGCFPSSQVTYDIESLQGGYIASKCSDASSEPVLADVRNLDFSRQLDYASGGYVPSDALDGVYRGNGPATESVFLAVCAARTEGSRAFFQPSYGDCDIVAYYLLQKVWGERVLRKAGQGAESTGSQEGPTTISTSSSHGAVNPHLHDERLLEVLPFIAKGGEGAGTFYLQVQWKQDCLGSGEEMDPAQASPGGSSGFWVLPRRHLPPLVRSPSLIGLYAQLYPLLGRGSLELPTAMDAVGRAVASAAVPGQGVSASQKEYQSDKKDSLVAGGLGTNGTARSSSLLGESFANATSDSNAAIRVRHSELRSSSRVITRASSRVLAENSSFPCNYSEVTDASQLQRSGAATGVWSASLAKQMTSGMITDALPRYDSTCSDADRSAAYSCMDAPGASSKGRTPVRAKDRDTASQNVDKASSPTSQAAGRAASALGNASSIRCENKQENASSSSFLAAASRGMDAQLYHQHSRDAELATSNSTESRARAGSMASLSSSGKRRTHRWAKHVSGHGGESLGASASAAARRASAGIEAEMRGGDLDQAANETNEGVAQARNSNNLATSPSNGAYNVPIGAEVGQRTASGAGTPGLAGSDEVTTAGLNNVVSVTSAGGSLGHLSENYSKEGSGSGDFQMNVNMYQCTVGPGRSKLTLPGIASKGQKLGQRAPAGSKNYLQASKKYAPLLIHERAAAHTSSSRRVTAAFSISGAGGVPRRRGDAGAGCAALLQRKPAAIYSKRPTSKLPSRDRGDSGYSSSYTGTKEASSSLASLGDMSKEEFAAAPGMFGSYDGAISMPGSVTARSAEASSLADLSEHGTIAALSRGRQTREVTSGSAGSHLGLSVNASTAVHSSSDNVIAPYSEAGSMGNGWIGSARAPIRSDPSDPGEDRESSYEAAVRDGNSMEGGIVMMARHSRTGSGGKNPHGRRGVFALAVEQLEPVDETNGGSASCPEQDSMSTSGIVNSSESRQGSSTTGSGGRPSHTRSRNGSTGARSDRSGTIQTSQKDKEGNNNSSSSRSQKTPTGSTCSGEATGGPSGPGSHHSGPLRSRDSSGIINRLMHGSSSSTGSGSIAGVASKSAVLHQASARTRIQAGRRAASVSRSQDKEGSGRSVACKQSDGAVRGSEGSQLSRTNGSTRGLHHVQQLAIEESKGADEAASGSSTGRKAKPVSDGAVTDGNKGLSAGVDEEQHGNPFGSSDESSSSSRASRGRSYSMARMLPGTAGPLGQHRFKQALQFRQSFDGHGSSLAMQGLGTHSEAVPTDGMASTKEDSKPTWLPRRKKAPSQRAYGFRFRYARCRVTAAPSRAADGMRSVLTLRVQKPSIAGNGMPSIAGASMEVAMGSAESGGNGSDRYQLQAPQRPESPPILRAKSQAVSPGQAVEEEVSSTLLRPIEALALQRVAMGKDKDMAEHAVIAMTPLFLMRIPKLHAGKWLEYFRKQENQEALDGALGIQGGVVVSIM